MYSHSFVCVFALAHMTTVMTSASIVPFPPIPERRVSTLCESTVCNKGTVCRVVTACVSVGCFPFATCVPCVPDGVDAVCNANRYIYAVLMVKPPQEKPPTRRLTPFICDPSQENSKSGCPKGSVCVGVEQSKEIGTCCFGKPDLPTRLSPKSFPMDVSNTDPICDEPSDLCGEKCPEGTKCLPKSTDCGKVSYKCVALPKHGSCPPVPFSNPAICMHVKVGRFCDNDSDCKGDKKCCTVWCGGRTCLSP